ncbi:MAG: aminomethyl-transferring glycine dehydrogenase subunit GcvPB [Armatimonadetes bacterium]|nr:aminomethyl-transferring glycine dehydrogenase subunit GcvPB [Armatimonadota bacterium]
MNDECTVFELSSRGRTGIMLPSSDVPDTDAGEILGESALRAELPLPELSQADVVRHYTRLSLRNYGVDTGFYPLGSCTMKHNPKIHESLAALSGFSMVHPYQDDSTCQGILRVLFEMERFLAEIAGMDSVTLQPAAGAQGELVAMMLFKKHYERLGDVQRRVVLVPDSSHGTNPATASRCGYEVVKIPSGRDGCVDLQALRESLSDDTAALMLTNPNTLGLFEVRVTEIARMVHEAGALLYCDGANMNAILGVARPGDMGFDAMHFNLHKTFASPHGGGGPGSGPVAVKSFLAPYLPIPRIVRRDQGFVLEQERPHSIGRAHAFLGNVGVIIRAYLYILGIGGAGLRAVSENAVLNANYLLARVGEHYDVPYGNRCMHEFVASATRQKVRGVRAADIAKRLMDFAFHPPTIYFPLIVPEALMIEPTETESIETLDAFADAMISIAREAESDPDIILSAPHSKIRVRIDEAQAARKLELTWQQSGD